MVSRAADRLLIVVSVLEGKREGGRVAPSASWLLVVVSVLDGKWGVVAAAGSVFSVEEVKFPNIQAKSPLVQLEAISSHPMACYLGKETDSHLSTTSFQVAVESDKVSPQPPFLQAKQLHFPQPLLIRLVL
ncbi:hypothetical protein QYF61_005417 [Mycteria americana]|uniref:Uncharacterized protein n=1 Tax=Mycteria americana TaxID=33587 RepID=A0AAN7S105_MYCAM|nr:hypothetical protein QYF61_005417 [Mycteria americana]